VTFFTRISEIVKLAFGILL